MAREDRPYQPWFYKDWLTSPDRFSMTYEQRGVYRDLLDFAWDQHGLPADLEQIRSMLGLDRKRFSMVWPAVSRHFTEQDGRYTNAKQERVRAELDAYREGRREAGRLGGKRRAERQAKSKQNSSTATVLLEAKPKPSSASSSAKTPTASRPSTLIRPRNLNAVFEHPRFDVPQVWHDRRIAGLADGERGLSAFYEHLSTYMDAHPDEDTEPRFEWLTQHFERWVKVWKASSSDIPGVEETRRRLGLA